MQEDYLSLPIFTPPGRAHPTNTQVPQRNYTLKDPLIIQFQEWLTPQFRKFLTQKSDLTLKKSFTEIRQSLLNDQAISMKRLIENGTVQYALTSVLSTEFCERLLAEVMSIHKSYPGLTLNIMGVNLLEFGFGAFLEQFTTFMNEFLWSMFPSEAGIEGFYGAAMYIVSYEANQPYPRHPDHTDQCDLTLNMCLEECSEGGALMFHQSFGHQELSCLVPHAKGRFIIHPGALRHSAQRVTKGRRTNLIIWMKRKDSFPQFGLLPPELQKEVVLQATKEVDARKILTLGQCNKKLHKMCNDEDVWQILFKKLPLPQPYPFPSPQVLSRMPPPELSRMAPMPPPQFLSRQPPPPPIPSPRAPMPPVGYNYGFIPAANYWPAPVTDYGGLPFAYGATPPTSSAVTSVWKGQYKSRYFQLRQPVIPPQRPMPLRYQPPLPQYVPHFPPFALPSPPVSRQAPSYDYGPFPGPQSRQPSPYQPPLPKPN